MQYKTLAALLFATAAVAAPAAQDSSDLEDLIGDLPSSIVAVLQTAVPTTYIQALYTDPAFASSEVNNIEHGTYPAWYNSLPDSVKGWATTEAQAEASALTSAIGSVTDDSSSATGSSSAAASTDASSSGGQTSTATASVTSSGSSSSSSGSSSASSSSASSSTSSGGAAAATGGVAMSLAGAAGILGLAIAL
ncbi:uncharacterized protein N7459_008436 [Penicillium hispanicum]|uniref:uncharacterized protein n=1 Tax=Penicillium hispanicum TaxID=1080232 RepID=UPI0025423269|nr:uncharacterized protein N7459_008436 [Penicillium hispanicum]KAJ5574009.1 hypothetical protein N7459_008436 [Penicillium hispanicum]